MDALALSAPRRISVPIDNRWGGGEMAVLDFGDRERPVDLVFVHANGFNARTYRTLLQPLSSALRIWAPDLRGHGATRLPAEPDGHRSWKDHRDDLIGLLEAIGGPPVALAGHSIGGTSGLLAAALYLAGVLVIVGSLRRIFMTLTAGDPFHPDNVARLRLIGLILAGLELGRYAFIAISAWLLPGVNGAEPKMSLTPWFSVLVVFVLAEVFREGARLRREAELTI